MIEKIVERDADGFITKIFERQLSAFEERVVLLAEAVARDLRQPHLAHLDAVEVTIPNLSPALDPVALATAIGVKIAGSDLARDRTLTLRFRFPQETPA